MTSKYLLAGLSCLLITACSNTSPVHYFADESLNNVINNLNIDSQPRAGDAEFLFCNKTQLSGWDCVVQQVNMDYVYYHLENPDENTTPESSNAITFSSNVIDGYLNSKQAFGEDGELITTATYKEVESGFNMSVLGEQLYVSNSVVEFQETQDGDNIIQTPSLYNCKGEFSLKYLRMSQTSENCHIVYHRGERTDFSSSKKIINKLK